MERSRDALRSLPAELLQRIFVPTVFEMRYRMSESRSVEVHSEYDLINICSVSRRWREAAIRCCTLWTQPPSLDISPDMDSEEWRVDVALRIGQIGRHLARSGALPLRLYLCASLRTTEEGLLPGLEETKDALTVIVKECHRWNDVFLHVPAEALECLSPIRGNLPFLHKIRFSIQEPREAFDGVFVPPTIDYLVDAPALAVVSEFDSPRGLPITGIYTHRLEDLRLRWDLDAEAIYKHILESQSPTLERFTVPFSRCLIHEAHVPTPSFHCTLPALRELDFSGLHPEGITSFIEHLKKLTLPALEVLELGLEKFERPVVPYDNLFSELASLIRRSGCSLKELNLGVPLLVAATDAVSPAVWQVLSLSPKLEGMTLGHLDADALRRLLIESPLSPPSMIDQPDILPNLVHLRIQNNSDAQFGPGVEGKIDVGGLMDVFMSRNLVPGDPTPGLELLAKMHASGRQPMYRVVLSGYAYQGLAEGLVEWETARFNEGRIFQGCPSPNTAYSAALRRVTFEIGALNTLLVLQNCDSVNHSLDIMLQVLDELEALNLETMNTCFLERRKIPALLKHGVSHARRAERSVELDNTRRQAVEEMDTRVSALLRKWKPFFIRDVSACPYRWQLDSKRLCSVLEWDPVSVDDGEWVWNAMIAEDEQ